MRMRNICTRLVSPSWIGREYADMGDSAETSVGCPIGLQVVAPRNEDERLMAALRVIDRVLPLAV
jgi:hypothetical protein